jgi:hypothetical protein
MSTGVSVDPALSRTMRGDEMLQAEEVAAMLRLHGLGWGAKRLAKEFGCARNTVRRYLRQGGPVAFRKPVRRTAFDGLDEWLRERFFRHGGNADVVRQELASELGIVIGLRSVELRVHRWRRELKAQMRATVRFETAPGPHPLTSRRMQALKWPGDTSSSGGTTAAHCSAANGQRVRKTHPEGGLAGLGMSPVRICRVRALAGSGDGIAESNARV